MFKKDLTPVIHNSFQEGRKEKETFPNSFYEASVTLIPKPDKTTWKRKAQTNIFPEYRCKLLNKILTSWTQQYTKIIIC